jgi:dihydrofolate reductase
MSKLTVFNSVSLDGYFVDAKGDMSWAHKNDPEWSEFTAQNAQGGGLLLFGRVTYEMMASFWPTPAARQANAVVADRINALPKVVFSRSLDKASWNNTRIVKGDIEAEVQRMKKQSDQDLLLMGSGTIVSQLTKAGLIDGYQIVLNPTVLSGGRTMFEGLDKKVDLKLQSTRSFKNGNVVLTYERIK